MASPQLPVSLSLDLNSCHNLQLPPPTSRSHGDSIPALGLAVADTGAQMDVISVATIQSMGLDVSS